MLPALLVHKAPPVRKDPPVPTAPLAPKAQPGRRVLQVATAPTGLQVRKVRPGRKVLQEAMAPPVLREDLHLELIECVGTHIARRAPNVSLVRVFGPYDPPPFRWTPGLS